MGTHKLNYDVIINIKEKNMEKIRVSKIKFFILSLIIFLIFYLILFFNELSFSDFKTFTLTILITTPIVIFINLTSKNKKNGEYFSETGITYILGDKKHYLSWENLKITKKINYKYFMKLDLNIPNNQKRDLYLILFWPTEIDMIAKTKKYCPPNHELYKLIKEYAEKRKLPF